MKLEIPCLTKASVLVVGDIMLDRYWQGPTSRISPEAPVPVVKINGQEDRPGGAANVALNIASLGGGATLAGITGNDEASDTLATQLSANQINCFFAKQTALPTITKLRVMSRNQQLLRLDFEQSFAELDKTDLTKLVVEHLAGHQVIVLSDYNKGSLSHAPELITLAKKAGVKVLVDPKGTDFSKYRGASLLTPNLGEFEAVVGECKTETELIEKAQKLVAELELDALLITRSEQGMTLIRPDHEELHLPTQAKEVYDVTGAGDTVIATLALAVAAGASLPQASALANIAAGIVVGKLGTATVSEAELLGELALEHDSGNGVMSKEQLVIAVNAAKKRGEKVVMTNGCFDLLHAGHVSYLTEAKKLGNRLIVAVNDDASVKRLKGEGRPVNPVERRMAVLAGLGAVDWVVSFAEDTPRELIADVLPDILVKGGDYTVEQIAGGKEVIANGGEVKVLNFEQGVSTTEMINTIRLAD